MGKTALFFPGQASQYVGMGKDLYEASARVRELYKLASVEMGADIAKISFEGPAEELKKTRFTQPAILLHSLAVLTLLGEDLPEYDYAAGHSLGEYVALAVTGALSFEDAIRAVVKRAAFMEEACQDNPGTMAAVMGLNDEKLLEVCREASTKGIVIPANYNSKIQVAISGAIDGVNEAVRIARDVGAKRAVLLEVGGAFHSPLMATAKVKLEQFLKEININDPSHPVVANVTAQKVLGGEEIRKLLSEQVISPVKWSQTMSYLLEYDVKNVIEIGPGKVLSSLAKREMRPEKLISLDTLVDIKNFASITV